MRRVAASIAALGALLLSACGGDHSGFPADQCTTDCVTGNEILVVEPAATVMLAGGERQLRAWLVAADGSRRDVTADASWRSDDAAAVAVSATGDLTAQAAGRSTVTASLPALEASADVRVSNLDVTELIVSPAWRRLLPGLSTRYTATAVLSDGTTIDATRQTEWSTADTAVAVIDADGRATAIAEGETAIDARLVLGAVDVAGSASLNVLPAVVTIDEFSVEPLSATTLPGGRVSYRALALTSENARIDVTADTVWQSLDPSVATIDAAGTATALGAGDAVITADLTRLGVNHSATAGLEVIAPAVTDFHITPQWAESIVGQQQAYQATAVLANGLAIDVTRRVVWRSATPAVATISIDGVASATARGQSRISATYDDGTRDYTDEGLLEVRTPPPVPESLTIEPIDAAVLVGDALEYRCVANFSDGSQFDLSARCRWSVDDAAIAVIDALTGQLTGIAEGTTRVAAELIDDGSTITAGTDVEVIAPLTVESLQVTPAGAESVVLGARQFRAHALLSDGRKLDVTGNVAWTSDDPGIATVGELGLARARAPGTTGIRANGFYLGTGFTAAADFTVTPVGITVQEFRIVPPRQASFVGGSAQFDAELLLSDGRRPRITDLVQWSALDATMARGTERHGEFVGLQPGTTPVQAAIQFQGTDFVATGQLRIVDPDFGITGIEIDPPAPVLTTGGQRQIEALLLFSNGDAVDVTRRGQWTSADPAIAAIDQQGLAAGIADGTTSLSKSLVAGATTRSASGQVRVIDPAAELVTLRIDPEQVATLIGTTTRFTATGVFLDGSRSDVSGEVSWRIADPAVAGLISQNGLVLALAEGTTSVSAHWNGNGIEVTDSASIDVAAPVVTITELQVTPALATVNAGHNAQFGATAILSDRSHVDVTDDVLWSSDDTAIAATSVAPGSFEATGPGATIVTASLRYEGQDFSGQARLLVRDASPEYLELTPPGLSLAVGERARLNAIVHYSDNSTEDVSDDVAWAAEDDSIARVSSAFRPGAVTGVSVGLTNVSATWRDSLSATATVEVAEPILLTIDVLPAPARIAAGLTQAFTAIGTYDDERAIDITDRVLWTSDAPAVAAVVGGEPPGRVRGITPGPATISAALDGVTGSSNLTVTAAVVVGLDVAPDGARIRVDDEQRFVAIASLSDGGRRLVTDEATWTSTNTSVASISNRDGSAGIALGRAAGNTTITASYGGTLQASTPLEVLAPVITELVITPANATSRVGSNVYYSASAVLSDSSTLDVTRIVRWTSSEPDVAAIDNGATKGRATALSPGSTTIAAALGAVSAETGLTIADACAGRPDSVFIVSDIELAVGETAQMQVTGVFPNGCTQYLTEESATVWDSTDSNVFTIGNKTGIVTGIGPGTADAEVKHRSSTDTAEVTVTP